MEELVPDIEALSNYLNYRIAEITLIIAKFYGRSKRCFYLHRFTNHIPSNICFTFPERVTSSCIVPIVH